MPPVDAQVNIDIQLIPEKFKSKVNPKKPKEGYVCEPSFAELEKMTGSRLERVENFKVSNSFGSVLFLGETDLTSVDLADVITITQGVCEVYDDERHSDDKPAVGKKLNKPAIITLKNMKPGVN